MKIKIDLKQENFVSIQNLLSSIDLRINPMINSLVPGKWNEQLIPSIYLEVNDAIDLHSDIKIKNDNKVKFVNPDSDNIVDTVTYSGLFLDIYSFKNNLGLTFVLANDLFIKNYSLLKSLVNQILFIDRQKIIGYEKNGIVPFYAAKYKKSLMVNNNTSSAYAGMRGGLIGYLMWKGISSAVAGVVRKMEDEVIKKNGQKYTLKYLEGEEIIKIGIICEEFYTDSFEKFLSNHWTSGEPIKIIPTNKKEGCFIATMAYGDYNHPQVIFLREFRDNYLKRFLLGKAFIRVYYFTSPKVVTLFGNNKRIVKTVRICLDYFINRLLKNNPKRS